MSEVVKLQPPVDPTRLGLLDLLWRAEVLRALEIDGDRFQLLRGSAGDPTGLMHRLADMVPADAAVAALPGPAAVTRSDAYGRLLGALAPEAENGFLGLVGADYGDWVRHRNDARPGETQAWLFRDWCSRQPKDRARLMERDFRSTADPLCRLRDQFWSLEHRRLMLVPGRGPEARPVYAGPDRAETAAPFALRDGRIAFHSTETRGRTGATWFGTGCAGAGRLMPGLAPDLAARIEPRLAAAPMSVVGRIGTRAIVPVTPGRWYDQVVVARALRAEDDELVWDAWSSSGRWSSFFGRTGKLARHVAHLVLAGGVELTLTCRGHFEAAELAAIEQALPSGIWPLLAPDRRMANGLRFRAEAEGGFTVQYRQDRPECWGVVVGFASLE